MRKTITKVIMFLLFVAFVLIANVNVFRSEFPYLAFVTIIGSVIGFIYFPYNKFFKSNNKN